MIDNYTPGKDCQCLAHNEYECGCDADWTPREVYELREQRDRLLAEREQWRMSSVCRELSEQRDRLAEACKLLLRVIGDPNASAEDWWATEDEVNAAWNSGSEAIAAVKSESANINTKSESADIECQECLDQSRLLGMSAERECALLGKIDRIERERDEYKGILIELHNDINVIHSGNAIAKLNKMFKEENYN
jgi:hypothetical protein